MSAALLDAAATPLRAITALRKAGLTDGASITELRRLLGQLNDSLDVEAAGQALSGSRARNQLMARTELREQRIALLASSTVDSLPNLLTSVLLRDATLPSIELAGYNQWQLEMLRGAPVLAGLKPRLVGLLLDDKAVFDRVGDRLDLDAIEQRLIDFVAEIKTWTELCQQQVGGLTVLCTVALSPLARDRFVDYRSRARLDAAWQRMNADLLELGTTGSSTVVLSHEALALRAGSVFADDRLRHVARTVFSIEYLHAYAEELSRVSRADLGQAAKTLVLDLDNTLWGGVVGDDGTAGLRLGESYPGNAHLEVQALARDLSRQGVLLAVCSKNDDTIARAAVDEHPEMLLRTADLVSARINWQPKPDNIAEIAQELNLGLDSFVFLDDSVFEREHMRRLQPQVRTIELAAEPAGIASALAASGHFNTLRLTGEDLVRTDQYLTQARRSQAASAATTTEQYLLELGSVLTVEPLDEHNRDRIVQLFAKTNQFNLTGARYGSDEITRAGRGAFGVRLRDNYGDSGLICAVVIEENPDAHWVIGNIVLSCRAFSRGVETAVLAMLLQAAQQHGMTGVLASFTGTAKNRQFADFFPRLGFLDQDEPTEAGGHRYRHDLAQLPAIPAWIRSDSAPEVFHVG
jgi:FkbH-like protein